MKLICQNDRHGFFSPRFAQSDADDKDQFVASWKRLKYYMLLLGKVLLNKDIMTFWESYFYFMFLISKAQINKIVFCIILSTLLIIWA